MHVRISVAGDAAQAELESLDDWLRGDQELTDRIASTTDSGAMYALNPDTGAVSWTASSLGISPRGPVPAGHLLLLVDNNSPALLDALDAANGHRAWTHSCAGGLSGHGGRVAEHRRAGHLDRRVRFHRAPVTGTTAFRGCLASGCEMIRHLA